MKVLLDTHCLIKLTTGTKLASKTLKMIHTAEELLASPISAWEIAMLVKRGFIEIDRPPLNWYTSALLAQKIRQTDLSPDVLIASAFLEWEHRDPADRILVATALSEKATLATEDATILRFFAS